jgi:hypothetical protein
MEAQCYQAFMRSEHFSYILELKAKEGVVPGLPDFRLLRVLGQVRCRHSTYPLSSPSELAG